MKHEMFFPSVENGRKYFLRPSIACTVVHKDYWILFERLAYREGDIFLVASCFDE